MVDTNGKRVKLFRRQEDMQIVNERIAFRARAETAEAELARVREALAATVKAMEASITMRNFTKPTKLDEALCWVENDELAMKWANEARALVQAIQPSRGEQGKEQG